jgi:hypothetical protein
LAWKTSASFEIDATGATFIFQDVTATGVLFYNCDSVLFHGATLYYGTPPYSQGVIRAVAADGSECPAIWTQLREAAGGCSES